jgi:hypothetical protein
MDRKECGNHWATLPENRDSEANKEGAMLNGKHSLCRLAGTAIALVVCVLAAGANVPPGWFMAGSNPEAFETGVDTQQTYEGHVSAFMKSKQSSVQGFGTLMQRVSAEQYKGKRVRLSGVVKSQDVVGWAGLWMRVDRGKDPVAFDNMQNRSIKGTTEWRRYDVVLDVPKDATRISFGILLDNAAEVWLSGTKFDVVGADIPATGDRKVPDNPVNLEFTD